MPHWLAEYRDPDAERQKRKEYQAQYRKTAGYKQAQEKYRSSDKGRQAAQRQLRGNQLRRYGLTIDEYNTKLNEQNGVCAICGGEQIEGYAMSVDHDHKTGAVRDLLCIRCNTALGAVNDSITQLKCMITYLEKHKNTVN